MSRYLHILHGGRPYWEEVIDIFQDVTCLPKHAQACPYLTEIALSPIILLNNLYFLILNLFSSVSCIIQRKSHVWERSGSQDILKMALSQSDCTIFQFWIFHEPLKNMGPYFACWKNSMRRSHRYTNQCYMFAPTCPGMPILGQNFANSSIQILFPIETFRMHILSTPVDNPFNTGFTLVNLIYFYIYMKNETYDKM